MKVLQVIPFFYPAHVYGGPVHVTFDFCRELARSGCEVKILTTNANGASSNLDVPTDREIELDRRVSVRYCKRLAADSVSPSLLLELPKYVQWADVVHLSIVYSFPTIPCLRACRIFSKPLVWSPMGGLQRWEGSRRVWLKAQWDRVCRLAGPSNLTFQVTSEAEAAESSAIYTGYRFVNIAHGVCIPPRNGVRGRTKTLRLLFLGRLDPKKGLENLFEACKILNFESPVGMGREFLDWSLVVAGSGSDEYTEGLRSRVRHLGLTERVKMVGQVRDERKEALFDEADIVVVPSHTENFANVVVEALARGVPVLASTGTPWKRLEDFGCGLWVDNKPETLAAAIMRMSEMRLDEMGERARKWMEDQFSWTAITEQMIALYQESLTGNTCGRRKILDPMMVGKHPSL